MYGFLFLQFEMIFKLMCFECLEHGAHWNFFEHLLMEDPHYNGRKLSDKHQNVTNLQFRMCYFVNKGVVICN